MSVQSDKWIIKMAEEQAMISPFEDKQIREGKISFGVSSYGYDARVSNEFKICLLYTSPSPRDRLLSRMPSSA